jgi:hypothetical protein
VTSPIPHPVLPKTVPMIVGNGDGGIRVTDVVTVDLPPVSRENVKVICINVFRTLVVSYIIHFYHIFFLIMISIS